jgi:hypothetical protein
MPKMSPLIRLHHRSSLIIPSQPSNIKAPVGTPCLATSSNAATAASFNLSVNAENHERIASREGARSVQKFYMTGKCRKTQNPRAAAILQAFIDGSH